MVQWNTVQYTLLSIQPWFTSAVYSFIHPVLFPSPTPPLFLSIYSYSVHTSFHPFIYHQFHPSLIPTIHPSIHVPPEAAMLSEKEFKHFSSSATVECDWSLSCISGTPTATTSVITDLAEEGMAFLSQRGKTPDTYTHSYTQAHTWLLLHQQEH